MEPKIRLKGFEGEWKETTWGELTGNFKYGINASAVPYDGKNKYLRITDIDDSTRVFLQDNLTTPGTDLSYCSEYVMEDGDIVVARTGASVGKSFIYHKNDGKVYFAGFLIRMRLEDNVDKDFVFQNTLTEPYSKHIKLVSQRSGQPGVNVNELKSYKLYYPSIEEQKSIATFFKSLDSQITSSASRLASLKQIKTASLQSMFPQEGESVPKVRFKGFDGEWKKVNFGSIITECMDKTTTENEDVLLSSAIDGLYLNSELFTHFRGQSNKGYRKIKKNMLILSAQNLHLGNANVNLRFEHGIVSPAYKIYYIHDCNPELLSHWIKREETKNFFLDATTAGASLCRKNIVWEDLYKQTLYLPKDDEEQNKIAKFFTSLNSQISLQSQRLEKLKQIKAACLDMMFV